MENNEILYHYCSVDTFMKIIENKELWLGNSEKMNDYSEIRLIESALEKKLTEYPSLNNFMSEYQESISFPYICCFSKEGDLLSQWRGYADDGKGVAIGFDKKTIKSLRPTSYTPSIYRDAQEFGYDSFFFLEECIYRGEIQSTYLDNVLKKHYEDRKELLRVLKQLSYISKHSGFEEEKEVRLIYSPTSYRRDKGISTDTPISGVYYRSRNGEIVSYFKLHFANTNGLLLKDKIIHEVILGPKCKLFNTNTNKLDNDFLAYLKTQNIEPVQEGQEVKKSRQQQILIKLSKSTYR